MVLFCSFIFLALVLLCLLVNNNNNYNDTNHDNEYGAVIITKVIARVHPVHLMNVDRAPGLSLIHI